MTSAWITITVFTCLFPLAQQDGKNDYGHDIGSPVNSIQPLDNPRFQDHVFHRAADIKMPTRSLNGSWQLAWDDTVNTDLDNEDKTCNVQFHEIDQNLTGEFVGPVAGTARNAIISGTIEGVGDQRLLSFQQRENGYVCSYQATLTEGPILGVWHDTRSRSGTFRLLKNQ